MRERIADEGAALSPPQCRTVEQSMDVGQVGRLVDERARERRQDADVQAALVLALHDRQSTELPLSETSVYSTV